MNKRAKAQLKKIGRTKKTGNFARIAKEASGEYHSKEAGKRVAGSIFQKLVAKFKKRKK